MISFDQIPSDWRVPGTYIEAKPSYSNVGVLGYPSRALLIGQKLAAGTAAVATPYRITRRDQLAALFGAGSVAAQMGEAFLDANTTSELNVMALADPAGAAQATNTQTIAGTATGNGTLAIGIGPTRVAVAAAAGAAAATIAAALRTAINAIPKLGVTASGTGGSLVLTAKHGGVVGNDIRVVWSPASDDALPAGITVTTSPMAGGTLVPDITTALSAVAAAWYTDIASAWSDSSSIAALEADLATRYAAMGKRDAHGYAGINGTFGTLSAFGAGRNSPFVTLTGAKAAGSSPWQWAASLCGVATFYLQADPARQLRTLPLPGIVAPAEPDRFTPTEQDLLLRDGISTWDVAADGTVSLSRVITTYQTSALGIADTAWLDITTPRTLSRIRYDWASYLGLNYPRHKLADENSPAAVYSDAVVTPRTLHGSWAARCQLYERLGWIEDATRTSAASVFERDGSDRNRVNARQVVRVIGNMMVFAARLEFEA